MGNARKSSRTLFFFFLVGCALLYIPAVHAQDDITPPEVVELSFDPITIADNSSSQPITFTLHITDDLSGFQSASWRFVSFSGQQFHDIAISSTDRISGNALDGVYAKVFNLPSGSEIGTWHVADARVTDIDGNMRIYDDLPTYGAPFAMSAASWAIAQDFNGDGIPDVALITGITEEMLITVYPGLGNGTFGEGISSEIEGAYYPQAALIGDFNGDGSPDVVFREVSDEIGGSTPIGAIFGNGDGTFQSYSIAGSLPVGAAMAVGDLDGDGKSDLAGSGWWGGIFEPPHNGIRFLWGRADGGFDQSNIETAEGHQGAILIDDFNADGEPDIVWAWPQGKFVVMPGQGSRTFGDPIEHSSAGMPIRFASADFDNDGNMDLAVSYSEGVGVLSGNGDGTFQPVTLIRDFDPGTGVLKAYDIDRDARPDLAIGSQEGVVLMINNGDGSFRWYALTKNEVDGNAYSSLLDYAITDFDGDGRTDFLARWVNDVGLYLGMPASSTSLAVSSPTSTIGQTVTLTATVTPSGISGPVTFYDGVRVLGSATLADGQAVFTTTILKPGTHILRAALSGALMNFPASFSPEVDHSVTALPASGLVVGAEMQTSVPTLNLATGDFDHDGRQDLISGVSASQFEAWLGNGNGTFQWVSLNGSNGQTLPRFVIEDVNQDGNQDVVKLEGTDKGKGDGTFQSMGQEPGLVGRANSVWIGDFNGDGKQDRAEWWVGPLIIKLGLGDGFVSKVPGFTTSIASSHIPDPFVGDFNGDGNLDLALTTELEDDLTILLGNGDGTFQSPMAVTVGTRPKSPVTGDFNGDGKSDIAIIHADTGTIGILLGQGDGSFLPGEDLSLGGTLTRIAADDLNGDGNLDLAVLSTTSQRVHIFPGNGNGTFGTPRMYYVGTGPSDLAPGEFNGDGRMDLAVALSSGKIVILLGVNPSASSVSLSLSPASTSLSQQVTMTATVSPSGAGGWVTFYDGANILGSAQVSAGQAVLQTRLLGSGTHLMRVVFSGDTTTYSSSVSGVQIQKVAASSVFAFGPSVSLFPSAVNSHERADFNKDGITDLVIKSGGSVTVLLGQGNGGFAAATPTSVYSGSMSMVTADFNRDGNADVMLSGWGGHVNLLFGQGNGTFQASSSVPDVTYSGQLMVADVNADGAPDLLDPGNSSGSSLVHLNRGNGTFEYPIPYGASSSAANYTAVGDLNGDGLADLVVPDSANGYVRVLIGRGDGTFLSPVSYPTVSNPLHMAIGDFNGDGMPDLAVAGNGGRIGIMIGDGAGTLENWGDALSGLSGADSLTTCDCDGDGKMDLLAGARPNVRFLHGFGNGTFQDGAPYASTQGILLPLADLNLDARPDLISYDWNGGNAKLLLRMAIYPSSITLVVDPSPAGLSQEVTLTASLSPADASGTVAFYDGVKLLGKTAISSGQASIKTKWLGAGAHNLQARYNGDPLRYVTADSSDVDLTIASGRSGGFAAATVLATGRGPQGVAVGDLNDDGKQDIIVANTTSNTISVRLGNGDGTFGARVSYNTGSAPAAVAIADLNGDGKLDVGSANSGSNNVSVFFGNGNGTLQTAVNYALTGSPLSVFAADLNNDQYMDIVFGGPNGVDSLLGGSEALTVGTPYSYGGYLWGGIGVADLNNDGMADIPMVSDTGGIWALMQQANGTFSLTGLASAGTSATGLAMGDFNGDGHIDLATAITSSNIARVTLGNGNGTFQTATSYPVGSGPNALVSTDCNGDGKMDLLVVNGSDGSLTILLGKGDGTFPAGKSVTTGGSPKGIVASDFNGDGIIDVAVTNSADDTMSVFLGTKPKPTADFDGDGNPDIFWRHASTGENYIWYLDGVSVLGGGVLPPVADQDWTVVGVEDFNNDGKPDILWRNTSTGENYLWYLDGVTVTGGGSLPPVADQNWKVVGVADFNNDGKPDILWRFASSVQNYIWYLDGVTVLGGGVLPPADDQNWAVVGAADFNNDGKPDILWRNVSTGENYVWYLNDRAFLGGDSLPMVADQNWTVVGVEDFNNDGDPDILWRNTSTGENYVWYLDGVNVLGGGSLPPVADQNWTIVP